MASSTALFNGLSGLNANARSLDVIGNNIANSNTTAFKSSRLMFQNMFSRTLSIGSPPNETTGGTNPYQVGLGVKVAGTQRNFTGGTVTPTGDGRDLALEGRGFFIVQRGVDTLYTRDGSFRQNDAQELVTIDGDLVQGFGVDENFNIVPGQLSNLSIPLGGLTLAEATTMTRFAGNLNAGGAEATRGASVNILGTATQGLSLIAAATVPPGAGNELETASLLTEIEDPAQPGSGTPLFAAGQVIELRGAEKGSGVMPTARLTVAATTTVQNLMDFFRSALGLQTTAANAAGAPPGVTLNPATGVLTVTGNSGTVNDLALDSTDLRLLDSAGVFVRQPLVTAKTASADGESVRTSFVAYDSLGTPVVVELAMVLENASSAGTQWRYYVESADDSDLSTAVATGTLQFDTLGELQTTTPVPVQLDRNALGPGTPLTIALNFGGADGETLTALTDDESAIASTFQDGAPLGTLSGFAIGDDGIITGAFTNGQVRTLGQIALATFTNQDGLVDEGDNLYRVGANSGTAQVTTPGNLGTGRTIAGALEASNVDLSQEFINMILASTGYSANSRVIRTTDELMQQLLVLGR